MFSIVIHLNVIYSWDGKAYFSASLLQSSVSHDPSEIILICQIIAAQETFVLMKRKFKEHNLYEIDLFCNINIAITFDQFNASLLNKSIHLFQRW